MSVPKMLNKQLEEQENRWNNRADDWDSDIGREDHYVNFENGYGEFLKLEKDILDRVGKLDVGLDIGCGTGVTSELLSQYVDKIYLLDIAEEMLRVAQAKVPKGMPLHASVTEIPLEDCSVDVAISRGVVVSHLPREIYLDFFRELERVMKNGGIVVFDYLSNLSSVHFSIQSPKITFSKEEIEIILKGYGFDDIEFYGLDTNRVMRVSAKRFCQ